MKQIKIIIIILFLFFAKVSFSQITYFDEWGKGEVYLNSSDTLKGYIIYEETQSIVQYTDKNRSKVKTFSAFVLKGFTQNNKKISRIFTRFYWDKGYENVQKVPDFFEIIYDSQIKLLSKDKKIMVIDDWGGTSLLDNPSTAQQNRQVIYKEKIVRNLFIRLENGNIYSIYKPKKDFVNIFPDYSDKLEKYFKGKYISSSNTKAIIEMIKLVEK